MMLKGHTYRSFKFTPGTLECREACLADDRCQSYNVVMFIAICELNNRTKEVRPEDFVKDEDRYYMAKGPKRDYECWRSRSKSPSGSWNHNPGYIDAIDFQTSSDVTLLGYRLWGVYSGSTTFQVSIRLYRGSSLIAEKTGSYYTTSSVKTFEVRFSSGISLRAGILYTATSKLTTGGSQTHAHIDGMSSTSCYGITVTFKKSSKSTNGSSVPNGQIPALIFDIPSRY
ncbi:BTB/POZ domain-containing protein 3-like isoform X2 [Stylophora pistillata]|uniref:BTB/POZ domain-containing protein 3-like isoform X2 n=1 Tax=Stylophora pistillata TaxID=50429 RepID=UPI000C0469FC|nr:BTB/POZ domain-containing protein 3-like isoform X2 [Stylophora pistillata]